MAPSRGVRSRPPDRLTQDASGKGTVGKGFLAAGAVVLLFAASLYLVAHSRFDDTTPLNRDAASLLLSAASLALLVFATLIAFAGLIGWRFVENAVNRRVDERIPPRFSELQSE